MAKSQRLPTKQEQLRLDEVSVRLATREELPQMQRLLKKHHYLGSLKPVGERLYYLAVDPTGRWLAILIFSAAARHLKFRDQHIGWTPEQRRRRLSLVTNNSRFLILPEARVPSLGSRVLRLTLDRLSADWLAQYGHPIELVETFVDPEQFNGTVYTTQGWLELGQTDGWGRNSREYYVKHGKPKRLFVRELHPNSCRHLQAERLKPDLAIVEAKVPPRCTVRVPKIQALVESFKEFPEYRGRIESYPLWSLAALVFLAVLCDAPRGQKDLEKFASRLNQGQRRALGIRSNRAGEYPAPSQSTFCRFFQGVSVAAVNQTVLAVQEQLRGPIPKDELIAMDGKEPKHGSGASILTAVTVPSQHYVGCALVEEKTNEIPVAQKELIPPLDLQGRWVSLDALHTQDETARTVVMEAGGDYLLTCKKNQPNLWKHIQSKVTAPRADFPPRHPEPDASTDPGEEQGTP